MKIEPTDELKECLMKLQEDLMLLQGEIAKSKVHNMRQKRFAEDLFRHKMEILVEAAINELDQAIIEFQKLFENNKE